MCPHLHSSKLISAFCVDNAGAVRKRLCQPRHSVAEALALNLDYVLCERPSVASRAKAKPFDF